MNLHNYEITETQEVIWNMHHIFKAAGTGVSGFSNTRIPKDYGSFSHHLLPGLVNSPQAVTSVKGDKKGFHFF